MIKNPFNLFNFKLEFFFFILSDLSFNIIILLFIKSLFSFILLINSWLLFLKNSFILFSSYNSFKLSISLSSLLFSLLFIDSELLLLFIFILLIKHIFKFPLIIPNILFNFGMPSLIWINFFFLLLVISKFILAFLFRLFFILVLLFLYFWIFSLFNNSA